MNSSHPPDLARDPRPHAGLIARPDHVQVPFALTVDEVDPARSVALMSTLLTAIDDQLRGLSARVVLRGLRPHAFRGEGKSLDGAARTTLDGFIDLDLPMTTPAERSLRLATLLGHLRTLVAEGRKQKPPITAAVGGFSAQLREPEKFRTELLNRWKDRLKELVDATSAAGAPLAPLRLSPPGAVTQKPLSLEQVELVLDLPAGA